MARLILRQGGGGLELVDENVFENVQPVAISEPGPTDTTTARQVYVTVTQDITPTVTDSVILVQISPPNDSPITISLLDGTTDGQLAVFNIAACLPPIEVNIVINPGYAGVTPSDVPVATLRDLNDSLVCVWMKAPLDGGGDELGQRWWKPIAQWPSMAIDQTARDAAVAAQAAAVIAQAAAESASFQADQLSSQVVTVVADVAAVTTVANTANNVANAAGNNVLIAFDIAAQKTGYASLDYGATATYTPAADDAFGDRHFIRIKIGSTDAGPVVLTLGAGGVDGQEVLVMVANSVNGESITLHTTAPIYGAWTSILLYNGTGPNLGAFVTLHWLVSNGILFGGSDADGGWALGPNSGVVIT